MLFHMAGQGESLGPIRIALFLLSFAVVWRPLISLTVAMFAVHALYTASVLPYISNHQVFALFVDITVLGAGVWALLTKRRGRLDAAGLYTAFAPVVRLELLLLYFFVVFHKLNSGYFNWVGSCSAVMYGRVAANYPFLPEAEWARVAAIYLTVAVEAAIPIMLMNGPLRFAGVLIAFGFHFTLAMDPGEVVFNFTAMLLALYVLFLPAPFHNALASVLADGSRRWRQWRERVLLFVLTRAAAFVVLPLLLAGIIFRRDLHWGLTQEHGRLLWFGVAAVLLAYFLVAARRLRFSLRGSISLRPVSPVLFVFPALLFLNGLMPYLGGNTETSFAMFSNLRTEGGVTNHLFMPSSLQVLGYQRDLVRVKQTTIADLRRTADAGWQLTYFEFRSMVRRFADDSVTYERGGVTRTVPRIGDDAELMAPENRLLRKVLNFRHVEISPDDSRCTH